MCESVDARPALTQPFTYLYPEGCQTACQRHPVDSWSSRYTLLSVVRFSCGMSWFQYLLPPRLLSQNCPCCTFFVFPSKLTSRSTRPRVPELLVTCLPFPPAATKPLATSVRRAVPSASHQVYLNPRKIFLSIPIISAPQRTQTNHCADLGQPQNLCFASLVLRQLLNFCTFGST